jgi:hypothetical protein
VVSTVGIVVCCWRREGGLLNAVELHREGGVFLKEAGKGFAMVEEDRVRVVVGSCGGFLGRGGVLRFGLALRRRRVGRVVFFVLFVAAYGAAVALMVRGIGVDFGLRVLAQEIGRGMGRGRGRDILWH